MNAKKIKAPQFEPEEKAPVQVEPISTLIGVTHSQMMVCRDETRAHQANLPERMIATLQSMASFYQGFAVHQLEHMLQAATRAYKDGASDEMIFAVLCHDAGKAFSVNNHAEVIAAMLKPYVTEETYQILKFHQDFQGRHYYDKLDKDPNIYKNFAAEPWYDKAMQFIDQWDAPAFDPKFKSKSLEEFKPLLWKFLGKPK